MSLYINVNTPNKKLEKSPIDNAITLLAVNAALEKRNGNLPHGPSIDITFMLPDDLEVPPFKGMRMGGYTTDNQTLFFESAVPQHIVYSENASQFVAFTLQDAIDNAAEFFSEYDIPFNKEQWFQAILPILGSAAVISPMN